MNFCLNTQRAFYFLYHPTRSAGYICVWHRTGSLDWLTLGKEEFDSMTNENGYLVVQVKNRLE